LNSFIGYVVIPPKAEIQKSKDWIPGQARNDKRGDFEMLTLQC